MASCKACKNKECLKTGKPCKAIEKLLPGVNAGKLKGEHSFDPWILDNIIMKRKSKGIRKKPVHYNDNWEQEN